MKSCACAISNCIDAGTPAPLRLCAPPSEALPEIALLLRWFGHSANSGPGLIALTGALRPLGLEPVTPAFPFLVRMRTSPGRPFRPAPPQPHTSEARRPGNDRVTPLQSP